MHEPAKQDPGGIRRRYESNTIAAQNRLAKKRQMKSLKAPACDHDGNTTAARANILLSVELLW
jgi:hypothetical protein